MIFQIILNTIFLVELLSDIFLLGPISAFQVHFRAWPELVCQILNITTIVNFLPNMSQYSQYNDFVRAFEVIIFIRLLKLLTLLYEIRVMRIIIETARNMIYPLLNMFSVLLIIFYLYAILGMYIFGGKVQKGLKEIESDSSIPDTYHLCNFNDLFSSLVTLFTLMVVNNWMVQV